MPICCKQCGAELTERDAFCTKCGTPRSAANETAAVRRFCTKCGAVLAAEMKFCAKCGAQADVPAATTTAGPGAVAAGASTPSSSATAGNPPQAASSGTAAAGIPKIALIIGAVVALVVVVAIAAGLIHAAHRARQKAQQMEAAQKFEKSLAKFAASGNTAARNGNVPSAADINKALNGVAAAANAFTQNAQKQSAPSPLNGAPGATGSPASNSGASVVFGIAQQSAQADAALAPVQVPKPPPIVPVAGTGDPAHDWPLEYERTVGGPEADLLVRTGDINNLGFGWPKGFDPFSGKSTPAHPWLNIDDIPWKAPPGTDRVMVGTSAMPVHMSIKHRPGKADLVMVDAVTQGHRADGYSGALAACYSIQDYVYDVVPALRDKTSNHVQPPPGPGVSQDFVGVPDIDEAAACTRGRQLTMPTPIVLPVGALPSKINNVVVQIFADDFQPMPLHSHFQVSLNGTRIPTFEYAINALDQTGPIGKLLTLKLLPEYWPLLKSGEVKLLIDDPTTHVGDGYAVDFVRILVNPHKFKYQVSLTATVTDAETHKPIRGATVTAGLISTSTDGNGKCQINGIPAGLVIATANAPGYDQNSVPADLQAGQNGNAEIQLHRHQESTAALEQSIAQTGTATIYGIHFDTGSSKLRSDSIPALQAVLGLIKNHADARWVISGHTDNQGSDRLNIPLSKARAASVVSWLKQHDVNVSHLDPEGFGSTRPVADNSTANGRFLNRRVEVSLAK